MKRKPKRKRYDFRAMNETEKFVRSRFPDLRGAEAHCYFLGLQTLEREKGVGFGGRAIASMDDWAKAAFINRRTARKALDELDRLGLVEFEVGQPNRKKASKVRRKTAEEIRTSVSAEVIDRFVPVEAAELAAELQELGAWWNGEHVTPRFEAKKTGRIYTSKPNIQGKKKEEIVKSLKASLRDGEILVHADYSQAEPTVLIWALRNEGLIDGIRTPKDIYNDLSSVRRVDRSEAKRDLMKTIYTWLPKCAVPKLWDVPAGHYVHELIGAVEQYRQLLWRQGSPGGGTRRHIHTLLGRRIVVSPGDKKRPHRGSILSWQIQGTVADVFNAKLRLILDLHHAGPLRFLLQQYDGLYAACPDPSWVSRLGGIFSDGIPLNGLVLSARAEAL